MWVAWVGIVLASGVVEVCDWGVVELNAWVLVDDCCCWLNGGDNVPCGWGLTLRNINEL